MPWHLITPYPESIELNAAGMAVVEVAGKRICLAQFKGQWFAFSAKCPHASGPMEAGFIDAVGNVVCPVHRYRFSIRNGRNTSGEGFFLKTYPLEMKEEGLYIEIKSGGLFGF